MYLSLIAVSYSISCTTSPSPNVCGMWSVEEPKVFDATPELGMGFHFGVLSALTPAEREDGVIVLNGELAVSSRDILDFEMFDRWQWTQGKEFSPGIRSTLIMAPEPAPKRVITPSDDVALFRHTFGRFVTSAERYEVRGRLHASPPFPFQAQISEELVRFSAFRNDRRIRPDGSLLPGTYVTNKRDAAFAPSGFAVVGQYALPNPIAAGNRFDIKVPPQTAGLVGTVLPAFGQAGGGVEIELTKGAPPNSLKAQTAIPEY
jgi:hypothetical protein